MASKKKTKELPPIEVDSFSKTMFAHIGIDPVPRVLAETLIEYKRVKDSFAPGRLTAEGYATVITLAKMKEPGAFTAPKPEPSPEPPPEKKKETKKEAQPEPKKEEATKDSEVDNVDPFAE